ncbi:MAG: glutamate formimidoyltransferase [Tenericutes bacterium HGW-Tenericutes-6]|jgi:glutamate formiminotransferase|nr:MAG: glutamate formimidoyltransferase [Tenericutes bacterium HGW-Tenericutes-6]
MPEIVQCVPNISEGKDLQKINRIVEPLRHHSGFKVISVEPDKDYHRTVITLIGDPNQMIMPLINFYALAAKEIDMNLHHGEHPRMGAVDVCPFIPISGITMEGCVNYAKMLADHIAYMYQIPVYLYAEAASNDLRKDLPTIRKGEFEGFKDKIKDPLWKPDYGQSEIHKTFGVTAIGARMPLIAYNIDLNTADEKPAKQIAKYIRQSSGGFKYIQAGPAYLEDRGHVQVTMNILDYKKNPIYRIFETVQMELKAYQLEITSSEVIGLIPKDTLYESMLYYAKVHQFEIKKDISLEELTNLSIRYLKIRDFTKEKIIEAHL